MKIYDLEFLHKRVYIEGKIPVCEVWFESINVWLTSAAGIVLNQYAAKPKPLAVLAVQHDKT